LADAALAVKYGIDSNGTFVFYPLIDEPGDPSSLLTLTDVRAISSQLQLHQSNKIIVRGVKIQEGTTRRLVWSAKAARLFGDDGNIVITLADTETWPDETVYGELWAKYEEEEIGSNGPTGLRTGGAAAAGMT